MNKAPMKRIHLMWQGLLLAMLSLPATALQAADAIAMITDLSGEGHITRQGQPVAGEILAYLEAGDMIQTGDGSRLTLVYFASSREYSYQGKVHLRVDAAGPVVIEGKQVKARSLALAGDSSLGQAVSQNYGQAAIVMRGAGVKRKLSLDSPKNTNVLSVQPEFHWQDLGQGTGYHFILSDETGKVIHEDITESNHYALGGDMRLKRDGYYTWRIDARQPSGQALSSSADFVVLSQADYERVEAVRPQAGAALSERVLFAALLEQLGVRDEARRLWQALARERPDDPVLMRKAGF